MRPPKARLACAPRSKTRDSLRSLAPINRLAPVALVLTSQMPLRAIAAEEAPRAAIDLEALREGPE